ncbi:MAG: large conductance mechanosensitive channel protein MscL [Raoultibacter sp.]
MKKFLNEFKEFINRSNVMDLAVAVVIGAAFTAIVNSVVTDLITPLITSILGGVDFSSMKVAIPLGAGESTINYGNFINAVIQFVIIAFVVFLMVKALNKAKGMTSKNKRGEEIEVPKCPDCLEEVAEGATRCPHCTAELPEPAKSKVVKVIK